MYDIDSYTKGGTVGRKYLGVSLLQGLSLDPGWEKNYGAQSIDSVKYQEKVKIADSLGGRMVSANKNN